MDFLESLFPTNPAYAGLLSVERVKALQRNALLRGGLGVLGATTGPNPQATGPALAQGLGPVLQNFPQELAGAAEGAARMRSFEQEQGVVERRRSIVESNPRQKGESEIQWLTRLYPEFVKSGDTEVLGRLTQLLSSVQPDRDLQGTPHQGINPTTGKKDQFLVDRNGKIQWLGVEPLGRDNPELEAMRRFTREDRLNDDYNQTVKPWLVPFGALQRALMHKNEALNGNGPAQIQMLYAFINTLDNSVVREGEVGLITRAAPLLDRAKQFAQKYAEGKAAALPPEMLRQMAAILDDVQGAFATRFDAWRTHYTKRAQRWGVDPESFIDIPDVFGSPSAPSPGARKPIGSY